MSDKALEQIERDAAKLSRDARSVYAAEMKALRADFAKQQRAVAAKEREELKRIERWRLGAVAAIEGRPVSLSDVRSLKDEDTLKDERGVSLPKLKCLSGGAK